MSNPQSRTIGSIFELQFPQSVGIYSSYADAQKAVDYLADEKFEVQNLAIVGTDLKSVERVLGRRTWSTVLLSGVQSGVSTGLLVALVLLIFVPGVQSFLVLLLSSLAIGIVLGMGFAAIGYAMSRGRRDFTSVTQTVATKYEVLCEHKVAARAREMLLQQPGARAAAFE
ncbi:MAG: PROBABLE TRANSMEMBRANE PROTEIN [uncultured Friedmanniella sp.]|uniref:PROBABLE TRANSMEMBRANE PROTEIN n=1 Tax=uncultured Friedmanniella sp. TaxID=335381 RepID=A0A6J4KE18_9ACTN|nr:MAG: PROBABLE TRANSMEMBRANE PROTEIN [uncultured Friedmanniella sp.]